MSNPQLINAFTSIIAAITEGKLDDLDPLIRYDVIDHNLILGQGDGLPGLKYWARTMRTAMPDLTATICDTVSETNKIAARVHWAGTQTGVLLGTPPTHSYLEFESFYILHFSDGKAVEWRDVSDTRDALRSLHRRARLLEARNSLDQSAVRY
jgi:predicted ester cyclase